MSTPREILKSKPEPVELAPAPTASNTLLFQMMLHFRAQAEGLARENATQRDVIAMREYELAQLQHDNHDYIVANRRGAEMVQMKHQAGLMLTDCTDRFGNLLGTMRREVPETGAYMPEAERILLRADHAIHMLHGVNWVDLTADTEMEDNDDDGEETETDDEIEL